MLHPKMKNIYVGADIHKKTHTAVIINCFSEKLSEITFENNAEGFGKLAGEVRKHMSKRVKAIYGLEDTTSNGRSLAAFLLKKGFPVKAVDAVLTHSERRNQAIAHKTDSYDALCIARVLLNRLDELPDAIVDDRAWVLKLLVSRRKSIVRTRAGLKNQVHSHIMHHYPSYRQFFNSVYCKSAMEFWRRYPSPSKLREAAVEEVAHLLHTHSSGFFDVEKAREIFALVARDGDTQSLYQEKRDFVITHCIDEIRHCDEEIQKLNAEMQSVMMQYPYKLETMPGIELVTAAALVSEIVTIDRFSSAAKLAKYAGIAPITYSSGAKDNTFRNRQGNRRLYQIFHDLAARSINDGRNNDTPVNGVFYDYYHKKLKDGKTEHQAIVCVMRRLVNMVYSMMKHEREYFKPTLPKTDTK